MRQMTALDSAHQISLSMSLEIVLIVVGASSLDLKNSEIGHVSIYISTTSDDMVKVMAALDSAHQICLSAYSGSLHSWILKNSEIEANFDCISTTSVGNKWRYRGMHGTIGFNASNRCIYPLDRCSDHG